MRPIQTTLENVTDSVKAVLDNVGQSTILVVDDNRRDARLVRRILKPPIATMF